MVIELLETAAKTAPEISVIVPTMNEEQVIEEVLEGCKKSLQGESYEIIVVDNSTDNTSSIALAAGATVIRQVGVGVGDALAQGLERARGEIIVFLDGDGTYPTDSITDVIEPLRTGEADVVNTNRFSSMEHGAMLRLNKIGNRFLTDVCNLFFRTRIRDSQSGMKALMANAFRSMALWEKGFAICTEILAEASRLKFRIKELDIHYAKRKGVTKLNPMSDGLSILCASLRLLRGHNPLMLFGVSGMILFAASFIVSIPVIEQYLVHGTFGFVGRALVSVVMWLMGMLMFFAGLILDTTVYSIRRLESKLARRARNGPRLS